MLSTDFQSQVREIVEQLPNTDDQQTQIGLYSATMSPEMDAVARRFMQNPIEIRVAREMLTLEGIRQFVVEMEDDRYKFATLMDLYSSISICQMMIYCNSKRGVEYLCRELQHEQVPCEAIHGQMMTAERNEVMKRFRSGDLRVLITTDLLCRGIDVQQVNLVINYDFPREIESYLHRIGRGGRFGRKGYAINFVVNQGRENDRRDYRRRGRENNDMQNFKHVVEFYETQIDPLPENVQSVISS
jgi:translation initiation factor 4A